MDFINQIIKVNHFIFQRRFLINTTTSDLSTKEKLTDHTSFDYSERIFSLILELVIFATFTYLTYLSYKKFEIQPTNEETSEERDTRIFWLYSIKCLILANGSKSFK